MSVPSRPPPSRHTLSDPVLTLSHPLSSLPRLCLVSISFLPRSGILRAEVTFRQRMAALSADMTSSTGEGDAMVDAYQVKMELDTLDIHRELLGKLAELDPFRGHLLQSVQQFYDEYVGVLGARVSRLEMAAIVLADRGGSHRERLAGGGASADAAANVDSGATSAAAVGMYSPTTDPSGWGGPHNQTTPVGGMDMGTLNVNLHLSSDAVRAATYVPGRDSTPVYRARAGVEAASPSIDGEGGSLGAVLSPSVAEAAEVAAAAAAAAETAGDVDPAQYDAPYDAPFAHPPYRSEAESEAELAEAQDEIAALRAQLSAQQERLEKTERDLAVSQNILVEDNPVVQRCRQLTRTKSGELPGTHHTAGGIGSPSFQSPGQHQEDGGDGTATSPSAEGDSPLDRGLIMEGNTHTPPAFSSPYTKGGVGEITRLHGRTVELEAENITLREEATLLREALDEHQRAFIWGSPVSGAHASQAKAGAQVLQQGGGVVGSGEGGDGGDGMFGTHEVGGQMSGEEWLAGGGGGGGGTLGALSPDNQVGWQTGSVSSAGDSEPNSPVEESAVYKLDVKQTRPTFIPMLDLGDLDCFDVRIRGASFVRTLAHSYIRTFAQRHEGTLAHSHTHIHAYKSSGVPPSLTHYTRPVCTAPSLSVACLAATPYCCSFLSSYSQVRDQAEEIEYAHDSMAPDVHQPALNLQMNKSF